MKRSLLVTAFACTLGFGNVSHADVNAGAYLAGRQASYDHDFIATTRFMTESLIADPTNHYLLDRAMTAYVGLGHLDRARVLARAITDAGYESQVANLVLQVNNVHTKDWDAVFAALEQGHTISPLIDGVVQAWAHLGNGDMTKALAGFDRVIQGEGMAVYGITHKAFAQASVGDFEGAVATFETDIPGGMRFNRNSGIAYAQVLSQLGRNDEAVQMLNTLFGVRLDPGLADLRARLETGEAVPYSVIITPVQGVAEVYHATAGAIQSEAPPSYTLMYARGANFLWPENAVATLMTADLLEDLGQYELANSTYQSVPRQDPAYHAAELGRADVLRSDGRLDAAIEVLSALARSYPDVPQVFANQGDTLRQAGNYSAAGAAYSRALELYGEDDPAKWFVLYTRGICMHQTDNWSAAEADFRAALALRPDQPQVLNYLGYSLVERGEKLDEALLMLETAASVNPENGAIIDSLGWVMFQLGHYHDAVGLLETAAELEPVDPVVNDHLGDVYWAVGRVIEARFQWQRALSFDPKESEADRIRDKLQRGLDMVRLDEGLKPIRVASGDD